MYILLTNKRWLSMVKLFMLTVFFIQIQVIVYAQKITLKEKNSTLIDVFDKISEQSGIDFLVPSSVLKGSKPVSIQVEDTALETVMKILFSDRPLTYKISKEGIVVTRKQADKTSTKPMLGN